MKKFLVIPALMFSMSAFANPFSSMKTDFRSLEDAENGVEKIGRCLKQGWDAATPTDEQKANAEQELNAVKAVFDEHKEELKLSFRNLMASYAKHPIVKDEVVAAETELHDHIVPVKEAARDAHIDILNTLSADQRAAFDKAVIDCFHD